MIQQLPNEGRSMGFQNGIGINIQNPNIQTPNSIQNKGIFGENQPITHVDENKNSLHLFIFVQKTSSNLRKTLLNNGCMINKKSRIKKNLFNNITKIEHYDTFGVKKQGS